MSSIYWVRTQSLVKEMVEQGLIQQSLRRTAAHLALGRYTPKDKRQKEDYQRNIQAHVANIHFHLICPLNSVNTLNWKVKIAYANSRELKRCTWSVTKVLIGVQVLNSDKDLTRDYDFKAVIPIFGGPNKGSSCMTVLNDKKGVIIRKGVHPVTLGLCAPLAQKLQGYMTAPWTYFLICV